MKSFKIQLQIRQHLNKSDEVWNNANSILCDVFAAVLAILKAPYYHCQKLLQSLQNRYLEYLQNIKHINGGTN